MTDETPTRDDGMDAGGKAHTSTDEGHPAGDGARTDRDTGGPTAAPDAEENLGKPGVAGDNPTPVEPDR